MSPTDSTVLEEVRQLRADIRVLSTKLFGDDEGEQPTGRVPALEAARQNHETRLSRLEKTKIGGRAIAWAVALAATVIDAAYHLWQTLRH